MEKNPHFGLHLTYDAYGCPIEFLSKKEVVRKALNIIPKILKMRKLHQPFVLRALGNNIKDPGGFSGFVIIAESHVSIHTFDKRGFVSADIYSCKDFDIKSAIGELNKLFNPKKIETNIVIRGKEYPSGNIY